MRTYGTLEYDEAKPPLAPRAGWRIRAEPHVMVRLKRLLPRVAVHRSEIIVFDTPEVARDLTWVCDRWPLRMDAATERRLTDRDQEYRETRDTVTQILDGYVPPSDFPDRPAREPREYQLTAAAVAAATGRLLLTDELGLGKTFSSLLLLRDPDALPALVVTLTHLPRQWRAEIQACLPWLTVHIANKTEPYDPGPRDVLILNYAKLAGWGFHLEGRVNTVIFDEAQELRHAGTHKYEAATAVAGGARYRVGLTATPVYNYGGEIFNVVSVLDDDVLGARDEFSREWCGTGDDSKLIVREPAALGAYLREEGVMLRRTRREVRRELPEVQRIPHSIDLDEPTLEANTTGADALAEMIVAKSGTNTELWRAAGEFDWRLRHATGLAKAHYVSAFVQLLLESGEPVVLFGWHRDVYTQWNADLFGHRPAFFTGEESPNQKDHAAKAFMGGDTNLLIMSLRAGAGLDGLQERAHVAVFGELDWSPGVHDQCIGRLHRDGQVDPVLAYFLVADSGSDPAIAEVLNLKRLNAEPIVEPDLEPLAELQVNHDRVKLLAEQFLARRREVAA